MAMQDLILEIQNGGIKSDLIKKVIADNAARLDAMEKLYERYKATKDGVPIKTRVYEIDGVIQEGKINRRLNNDFFSEIIDTKTGYFVGKPVSYVLNKESVKNFDVKNDILQRFNKDNNVPDLDSETSKIASICGYCGRLLYLDKGVERVKLIYPFECVVLYTDSISRPFMSFYFYGTRYTENKKVKAYQYIDVYDATTKTTWKYGDNHEYVMEGGSIPHMIPNVPLFGISNNDELQGDAEKVLELIDAYDRTLSDYDSELEQFRLAYMAITGATITKETLKEMRQTGAISLPEGATADFLVKQLSVDALERLLDRLEANINRFAKHVNMSDEQFAGNQTGVAMKYKMLPLESKCITAERKFITGLQYQYGVLSAIWNVKNAGLNFDPLELEYTFTRNFPLNLAEDAETAAKLKGIVSDRTLLGLLPFIKDVDKEIEQIQAEKEANMDLFELGQPNGGMETGENKAQEDDVR